MLRLGQVWDSKAEAKEARGEMYPKSSVLLKRDLVRPLRATQYMQTSYLPEAHPGQARSTHK